MGAVKKIINIYRASTIHCKSACQTFLIIKSLLVSEFQVFPEMNVKELSDSWAVLYLDLEVAKRKFGFILWKKSKAKKIKSKQSLGFITGTVFYILSFHS